MFSNIMLNESVETGIHRDIKVGGEKAADPSVQPENHPLDQLAKHAPSEEFSRIDRFKDLSTEGLSQMYVVLKNELAKKSDDSFLQKALRNRNQQDFEGITMEIFFRSKGKEGDKDRQVYNEWNLIQNRRADRYSDWERQMQEKYGQDAWLQKVTGEEWYKIEKLTQEEQAAYQKYLGLKADAAKHRPEIFRAGKILVQENIGDGEILKATGLTVKELDIVKAHPLYGLFELVDMIRGYGSMLKQEFQEFRGRQTNDYEINAKFNKRHNEKAIRLIKFLLTTESIKNQLAELRYGQPIAKTIQEEQTTEPIDAALSKPLSPVNKNGRNRAQIPETRTK